jgi:ketosteroid isomerase-like protein
MTITASLDIHALSAAIETRNADGVLAWYAPDAELTIVDRDHSPSQPQTYRGIDAIGEFYRDVCGRNVDHEVHDVVATATGLAYVERCRYPDNTLVLCVTVAELADGKITRQTAAQSWDD